MKYELGEELKDIVTGFVGVVMGRTEYLTGCNHYGLVPRTLKDGIPMDYQWIDETRLRPTGNKLEEYKAPNTSGPEQNAPSW
jgi:hypothetical protein